MKKQNSKTDKFAKILKNRSTQTIIGLFFISFSIFLFASFISFFFSWENDQSIVKSIFEKRDVAQNLTGKFGARLSHFFIYECFGLASFVIPILIFFTGIYIVFNIPIRKILISCCWALVGMVWNAMTLSFFSKNNNLMGGMVGLELNHFLRSFIADFGLILLILFGYLSYFVKRFKITVEKIKNWMPKNEQTSVALEEEEKTIENENDVHKEHFSNTVFDDLETAFENEPILHCKDDDTKAKDSKIDDRLQERKINIDISEIKEEKKSSSNLAQELVKTIGEFDPTLDLKNYKFPSLNLLKEFDESISIDTEELESNKNKIVDTLSNYKIGISEIKATVGPTITLYEIIPEAGIRISKIKNLEDDMALSLSALGIRIIAPIPGKGTIGIEVPNKKANIVSMKSIISSKKFQESKMELPIAIGKTISNETFTFDLTKAPHLLMAGATGQGKSVGLNAILTSLLYKKHPAEIKFVLVDPKKVELTLFNKIERHYLAKLPNTSEAIITNTTKVIHTLNSLCIEMDRRYEMLKNAMVRNIKEYNDKFRNRRLNPNENHHFLPYIVLIIDEFADLIMTAGKEVEMPITRLAQLARAIGIHLIIATQRPSVNVITGTIKANFPLRIAFKVTSKIDSRTILDAPGADQLVGRGDLLFSNGNDLTRMQCAFIDTAEIEKITDFIGLQKAYPEAYQLPEYIDENERDSKFEFDDSERDALFREAAETIVLSQQGSASLLQRKLKLGYNRAGRLIDQLESAGIVGPFEGSKAREVLIQNITTLHQFLENGNKN